ncbi:MAG: carboxypeptidase-like regulatory domain-containing protein [Tannerellaceae bacterium]|nr:carboxypeptidase-like regulatory domain-containing protein [Tannerellaceae bacterium]
MITIKQTLWSLFLLILLLPGVINAQERKFTISGTITDSNDGEDLAGATIQVKGSSLGTATNAYGFYSLSLASGEYTLVITYMGYTPRKCA